MDTAVIAASPKIAENQLRGAAAIRAIFDAEYYLRANPDVAAARLDPLRHYLDIGWAEGRNPSPLFDSDFYLDSNADIYAAGLNPLVHYVSSGAREGRNPHPLFDTKFYTETNADLGAANPLAHYLHIGAREHRQPNLLFDAPWYARQHPEAGLNPLAHYAEHGLARQLSPHPLFDGAYYLAQHPDVAAANMNPLAHYLLRGHLEVRNPHPLFDTQWYAARNPDIAEAKVSPLAHYVRHGARLQASPHPLFDTAWYLEQYKAEVGEADALVHYITSGAAALRQPNPLFDAAFYVRQNPDAAANPLAHYAEHGLTRRLSPHPLFDGAFYLDKYPDVAAAGMNPLAHYLLRGAEEVRDPNPEFDAEWYASKTPLAPRESPLCHYLANGQSSTLATRPTPPTTEAPSTVSTTSNLANALQSGAHASSSPRAQDLIQQQAHFTNAGPDFEEFDPAILRGVSLTDRTNPLLIAYYLPQFHPIAENDAFWGTGFTEWRQLARGIPRFPGHYQPRIPRDLGFYDLRDVSAIERQAALAKAAGVGAFMYYYYWFNGRRVLQTPLELLMRSDVDMPFALMWANENWTRTWDGSESEVLLRQDYLESDEDALLADFSRHFSDSRYLRIDGRPLFVIYNPRSIPTPKSTIQRWREKLRTIHGHDPLIFMAQTFGEFDPSPYGLDGAIEFPPHKLSNTAPGRPTPDAYSSEFTGRVIAYEDFVEASLSEEPPSYPLIKTIVPSWDNDARRPNRGLTLEGISPSKYQAWLTSLIERAKKNPTHGTPIVAINAWNEWAESAYLEPDVHYGAAYLNATARAYSQCAIAQSATKPVSVIVPNYNHASFIEERLQSILNQTLAPDEVIFLDDASTDQSVEIARRVLEKSNVEYRIIENEKNSGSVFKQWLKGIDHARNELIWIAESDDSADLAFLERTTPSFERGDVMASFGRISYIAEDGAPLQDLSAYYDGLRNFNWDRANLITAHRAFERDFAVKNVIPNASGLVFRKPSLSPAERERLLEYRFAGDWYFYALLLRGGSLAYEPSARSYFRLRNSSTSRSAFFTEQHLREHTMILSDLKALYNISDMAVGLHIAEISPHFPDRDLSHMAAAISAPCNALRPLRLCVAAHSFATGGGEVAPIVLANALKARGHHITYLVLERHADESAQSVRQRLRTDIPVVHWDEVDDPHKFVSEFGLDAFNSHNVGWEWRLACDHVSLGIPYIATLHGGYETVLDLIDQPHFLSYIQQNVTKWLYLSEKNKAPLEQRGIESAGFERVFNALPDATQEWVSREEFRIEHGIPCDAFVMVLCSRAIEEKGWGTAIDVARELAQRTTRKMHLVLIGNGPFLETARRKAAGLTNVTFLGHVDNPDRLMRCFDLGIFPTTYSGESFPLFVLECFQAGLPVVATEIGEISTMIGTPPAGAVIQAHADRDIMATRFLEAILQLLDDEASFQLARQNATARSAHYSLSQLAELYVRAFRETSSRVV